MTEASGALRSFAATGKAVKVLVYIRRFHLLVLSLRRHERRPRSGVMYRELRLEDVGQRGRGVCCFWRGSRWIKLKRDVEEVRRHHDLEYQNGCALPVKVKVNNREVESSCVMWEA